MVGRPILSLKVVGGPSRRSGRGRGTLAEVWKCSWDLPGSLEVVVGPSRMSGSGQMTLPEVRRWSGTLPEVQKWSGDLPGGVEVVG